MTNKKLDILSTIKTFKRPTTGQFIWIGAGLVVAIGLFILLNSFVACWTLTALPGIQPSSCPGSAQPSGPTTDGTAVAGGDATPTGSAPQIELPPPWDGASRVTILVMGYDFGDWASERSCPCRSDTMIVLTIDPVSHTAGMISVPRDMWVSIPGLSYNKINTALYLGDLYKVPGGGPELAKKAVENFLGTPIQYYALINFSVFENMIDTIGGVCLNIDTQIEVGVLYEHGRVTLEPGRQCVDGGVALGYARARYVGQGVENGDVDRSKHQQEVIMAIRDKLLDPANFLNLMAKAPTLYSELSSGITTNLSLNDAMRLAVLAKDIPMDSIQRGVIDYTMMQDATYNLDGQELAVLRPYPDQIRELVDTIFGSGTMQPMAGGTLEENMKAEAARIIVINGSGVNGMASLTSDYLISQGMNVTAFGNDFDYPDQYNNPYPYRTILIVHAGKPYAMQYLMGLMRFDSVSQIIVDFDPNAPADIMVGLGVDWGSSNPMP